MAQMNVNIVDEIRRMTEEAIEYVQENNLGHMDPVQAITIGLASIRSEYTWDFNRISMQLRENNTTTRRA